MTKEPQLSATPPKLQLFGRLVSQLDKDLSKLSSAAPIFSKLWPSSTVDVEN
jgi:hypothetical protein